MYDSAEEARQKLVGTIIAYKFEPLLVHSAERTLGGINLTGFIIPDKTGTATVVKLSDKDLNIRNLCDHLGYYNLSYSHWKQAVYVRRMPIRRSLQGLCKANLKMDQLQGIRARGIPSGNIRYEELIRLDSFHDSFVGNFPSVKSCLETLDKNPDVFSVAVSRELCFARDESDVGPLYIRYKSDPIGYSYGERFKLAKQYWYLSDDLLELGVEIA